MTSRPKTHAQGPGFTHTEYLATLAAGYETGWYDEDGRPAPWGVTILVDSRFTEGTTRRNVIEA
ncbi:MAG: hypothetical protein R2722_00050 [Tessaracoccus sp.]